MSQLMLHPYYLLSSLYPPSLLVTPDGKLTSGSSCRKDIIGPYIKIEVRKDNSIGAPVPDNFYVILNGVNIGTVTFIDPGPPPVIIDCSGRIFVTTNKYTYTYPSCETINPTTEIPSNAFLIGTNTIRIERASSSTYDTGAYVKINAMICWYNRITNGNAWPETKVYLARFVRIYHPDNGQTFTFNYP
jgi:hypothetical protein